MKIYDQNKQKRQNHFVILPLFCPDQRAELAALEIWEEKINRKPVSELVIISTGYRTTLGIHVSISKRVVKCYQGSNTRDRVGTRSPVAIYLAKTRTFQKVAI